MGLIDYISFGALAAVFGFVMKLSDLTNEHGLKLFYGDSYFFGALWGVIGALIVMGDSVFAGGAIANAVLAMILAFIIQLRIDYLNHAIGAVLIIVAFLLTSVFIPNVFFFFFVSFVVFGSLRAYIGDVRGKRDFLFRLSEPGWLHYYIVPFTWSAFTGAWTLCVFFAIYRSCYNIAKYGLYRIGMYSKL